MSGKRRKQLMKAFTLKTGEAPHGAKTENKSHQGHYFEKDTKTRRAYTYVTTHVITESIPRKIKKGYKRHASITK